MIDNITTIHHVCSLGTLCLSSQLCKDMNLKLESYPFDWTFSSCKNIIHSIEDDFKTFLDKSLYVDVETKFEGRRQCGHTLYNANMFNHHDPRTDTDYNYYKRCIERFRQLLKCNDNKLFIISYYNENDQSYETIKQEVLELNNYLKTRTTNYYIFVIIPTLNQATTYHNMMINDNVTFVRLYIKGGSYGSRFNDIDDNNYLKKLLSDNYSFQLKKLDILHT